MVGLFNHALFIGGITSLKDKYTPNKIVIKIVIFVEFRAVLLLTANIGQYKIQNFHFYRYLIVFNHHQNVT